ncbi:MAG: hypothetical protein WCF95_01225 [bacterium]
MKKIFISILIATSASFYTMASSVAVTKNETQTPTINIANTVSKEQSDSQSKPLKVKTTILTKKVEKTLKFEDPSENTVKKEKRDIELPSDVDKILKEMDIDDIDPVEEPQAVPVKKFYNPIKNNFFWVAISIVIFPIILFTLLIKTMQLAKSRFEEEKKEGPSKEEQFLDEIEKAQKTTKKRYRSLTDILGYHPKEKAAPPPKPSKMTSYEANQDDFDNDDEDFEFMVEEVVIVEEKKEPPKKASKQKPKKSETKKEEAPEQIEVAEIEEIKEQPVAQKSQSSGIIDSFEISENLKFILDKKDDSTNLVCQMGDAETVIMKLEKAQKFNKVRKIDSKPGRDVYMVKLDSWRGLVEIKENSVKYLMDI